MAAPIQATAPSISPVPSSNKGKIVGKNGIVKIELIPDPTQIQLKHYATVELNLGNKEKAMYTALNEISGLAKFYPLNGDGFHCRIGFEEDPNPPSYDGNVLQICHKFYDLIKKVHQLSINNLIEPTVASNDLNSEFLELCISLLKSKGVDIPNFSYG